MSNFEKLFLEIEMALGFLRAFLEEENFSDLYEDVCDTYSALVDAQMTQAILETVHENMKTKFGNNGKK